MIQLFIILYFFCSFSFVLSFDKTVMSLDSQDLTIIPSREELDGMMLGIQSDMQEFVDLFEIRYDLMRALPVLQKKCNEVKGHSNVLFEDRKSWLDWHDELQKRKIALEEELEQQANSLSFKEQKDMDDRLQVIQQAEKEVRCWLSVNMLSVQEILQSKREKLKEVERKISFLKIKHHSNFSDFLKLCKLHLYTSLSKKIQRHIDNPSQKSFNDLSIFDKEQLLQKYFSIAFLCQKHEVLK